MLLLLLLVAPGTPSLFSSKALPRCCWELPPALPITGAQREAAPAPAVPLLLLRPLLRLGGARGAGRTPSATEAACCCCGTALRPCSSQRQTTNVSNCNVQRALPYSCTKAQDSWILAHNLCARPPTSAAQTGRRSTSSKRGPTKRGCWMGLPFSSSWGVASSGTRGARVERATAGSAAAGPMPSAASLSCRSLRLACRSAQHGTARHGTTHRMRTRQRMRMSWLSTGQASAAVCDYRLAHFTVQHSMPQHSGSCFRLRSMRA